MRLEKVLSKQEGVSFTSLWWVFLLSDEAARGSVSALAVCVKGKNHHERCRNAQQQVINKSKRYIK